MSVGSIALIIVWVGRTVEGNRRGYVGGMACPHTCFCMPKLFNPSLVINIGAFQTEGCPYLDRSTTRDSTGTIEYSHEEAFKMHSVVIIDYRAGPSGGDFAVY